MPTRLVLAFVRVLFLTLISFLSVNVWDLTPMPRKHRNAEVWPLSIEVWPPGIRGLANSASISSSIQSSRGQSQGSASVSFRG